MAEASLLIRIKADGVGVAKGVNDATSQFKRLENTLSGFMGAMRGLFALAPVTAFVAVLKDAVNYAKQIADFAKKTETSLSEAQRLRFGERVLAREGGFSGMIEHLRKTRSEALMKGPEGEIAKQFAAIGIPFDQLKTTDAAGLFREIATGIETAKINAVNFAAALKLVGRENGDLLPSLARLNEVTGRFMQTGAALDESTIKRGISLWKAGREWWERSKELVRIGIIGAPADMQAKFAKGWREIRVGAATVTGRPDLAAAALLESPAATAASPEEAARAAMKKAMEAETLATLDAQREAATQSRQRARALDGVPLRHDELSRIGLFRGSEGQQGLRMMREQTSAVKDLHREVQNLSATVKQFMSEAAYTGPATSSF
jgi:hypothetical protein